MRTAPPQTATLAAQVEALSFAYGDHKALDGVSLEIPQGAVFGLLGPNGSGKTTLLSLLIGLLSPQAGAVRIFGQAPSPALRAQMGIVFQESCLDPLMTVEETLWLHGRLFGLGGADLHRRIAGALQLGLADRARQATRALSGGLKRRLELARALLTSPRLLLLDEPTSGLDPEARLALWDQLREANAAGTTLILSTNLVGEAERYCHTVAFVHHGRLVAQGSPADLKRDLRRDAVQVEWPSCTEEQRRAVAALPGAGRLSGVPPSLRLTVDSASAFVPQLFQLAGEGIRGIRIHESSLEDAYFQLVGSPLSEEGGG